MVYPRGGEGPPGRLTGSTRRCALAGCTGLRLYVRWPGGALTQPCSKGMMVRKDGQYQIL